MLGFAIIFIGIIERDHPLLSCLIVDMPTDLALFGYCINKTYWLA
jgi:hypothetical protein